MSEKQPEAFRNKRNICASCGQMVPGVIHVDLYVSEEEFWLQICRGCVANMEHAIHELLLEEDLQNDPDEIAPTAEEQAIQRGIA